MMIMRSFLVLGLALILSSPAHAGIDDKIEKEGQYWQRVSISSALYVRGPKAQQMLNRDIARCVVELRELERLGAVRNPIPAHAGSGIVLSEGEAELNGYEMPERDKDLFAEHSDYIDFEGCMLAQGWQRIKYVPYDVAKQARENYKKTHVSTRDDEKKMKFSGKSSNSSSQKGGNYDYNQ